MNGRPVRTKTLVTIVAFDKGTQLATVRLSCNPLNSNLESNFVQLPAPELIEVPVEFDRCGEYVITFDVKPGDDCIVDFYESGISHWLYEDRRDYQVNDGYPEPAALRRFDTQDATCRVTVNNLSGVIPGFGAGLQIRNRAGTQSVILHPDGVISITTPSALEVTAQSVNIEASNDIAIKAGGALTLEGTAVNITGASIEFSRG